MTLWPAALTVVGLADLATVNDGFWVAVTLADEVLVTVVPSGLVPFTVAVLLTTPAFRSARVVVRVAVHVVVAPGASDPPMAVGVQLIVPSPASGSVTWMLLRVVLPLLRTAKV